MCCQDFCSGIWLVIAAYAGPNWDLLRLRSLHWITLGTSRDEGLRETRAAIQTSLAGIGRPFRAGPGELSFVQPGLRILKPVSQRMSVTTMCSRPSVSSSENRSTARAVNNARRTLRITRCCRYPHALLGALRASCAGRFVLIGVRTGKTAGIGHFTPIRRLSRLRSVRRPSRVCCVPSGERQPNRPIQRLGTLLFPPLQ